LSTDINFWRLVESKIIQAEASNSGKWRLKGTCYVGRALIGQMVLEIDEKFAGAFNTLVGLGALRAPKIARTPSPVTKSTGSTAVLISLFIRAVRSYLSGFKKVSYVDVADAGTIVGGRLDVTRTIRLRAKGMGHQVAFYRSVLTADLPFNRCIFAALREVERLARISQIALSDVATARALRAALSECLPGVLLTQPKELAQMAAHEASHRHARPEVSDVISLAGAVLDAAGFGATHNWQRRVEHSWFINLERFFEEAIRNVVHNCLGPNFIVRSAQERPAIFNSHLGRYRANPDVVIANETHGTLAIADAKYKDFTDWPIASDVHELLAHAAAYGAPKAFFFYPDDKQFTVRTLGTSVTNCKVWAFGVTFASFSSDVRWSLQIVGLLET
jgi:5-methylcytosine-specific restriction endonuclease McrBC regulatory subunit McrC